MGAENSTESMETAHAISTSGETHHSPELRIVLIGGREFRGAPSNKSATGNIILGESVFETSRRTVRSVARQREVHGRQVTVVDTPGWWWHYPRENTPELDQMEIKNSVHLCPPGPHAFLLVIFVGNMFPQIFKESLQEHLQLFQEGVFRHTIVLFTVNSQCSNERLERKLDQWPELQWILEQCGNRKHVLNIRNRNDDTQVIRLLEKIEAMIIENAGGHYSIDSADGNTLREKMEAVVERASKRRADVQQKRRELKALIDGGKKTPTHLRLVMVGAQWSAKTSAGKTILRKKAFAAHHRRTTGHCEISYSVVAGRQLTVVDSPGWFYNQTPQETSAMDKLELENSMYLCPPGPHAVLLVVGLASAFNASYQRAVQRHMSLFTEEVWKHTIVVFTRGDWLGDKTVEERIESERGLQWLVEKCGNMYHVLDNTKQWDERQVTELLEKIEEMWAGNQDPHYEVDLGRAEQIEARKEAENKMAKRIRRTTERQERLLRELFRGERQKVTDIRVVLIGRKESGKSVAGNRILCEELFTLELMKKEFQHQKTTSEAVKHQRRAFGVNMTVVEAPGWSTDTMTPDWLKSEVLRCVSMCAPGPHAFLLVVPVSKAFTEHDRKMVAELLQPFGERVWRHCVVLFTWADWLSDRSVEEYIAAEGKDLKWLVEKCGNRYSALTFSQFYSASQLIQKITDMITRNKGYCFTTDDRTQHTKQAMLTEKEWNRREQELIDRMLNAVAQEHEEPSFLPVKTAASFDGAFIPSMSGDVHSEVGTFSCQGAYAKVFEWLSRRVVNSNLTSGIGSVAASASYVEKLDASPLMDDDHQQTNCVFPERGRDTALHGRVSTDTVETQRRHSF